MNQLDELLEAVEILRSRVERLRELRVPIDLFEDPYVIAASRNLARLDVSLVSRLREAEESAVKSL